MIHYILWLNSANRNCQSLYNTHESQDLVADNPNSTDKTLFILLKLILGLALVSVIRLLVAMSVDSDNLRISL